MKKGIAGLIAIFYICLAGITHSPAAADPVNVKVKLFNERTGEIVGIWDPAPNSTTDVNHVFWTAGNNLPKGAYKFQIIAEDDLGNQNISYVSCVKDDK